MDMSNMGMNCREFFGYLCYCTPTFEVDLLPAQAQDHLEVCSKCRVKLAQLKAACKLLRKREKKLSRRTGKAAAAVLAHAQCLIKRKGLVMPEKPQVDCQTVRQFLHLATDPLGEIFPSAWMEQHLVDCKDCDQEYGRLGQLRNTVIVSEILASTEDMDIDDIFPEAKPSLARQIHKLASIDPEGTSCEQVSPYYHSIAVCRQEPPVPNEIYLHARNCTLCWNYIIQLRTKLNVAIPDPRSGDSIWQSHC